MNSLYSFTGITSIHNAKNIIFCNRGEISRHKPDVTVRDFIFLSNLLEYMQREHRITGKGKWFQCADKRGLNIFQYHFYSLYRQRNIQRTIGNSRFHAGQKADQHKGTFVPVNKHGISLFAAFSVQVQGKPVRIISQLSVGKHRSSVCGCYPGRKPLSRLGKYMKKFHDEIASCVQKIYVLHFRRKSLRTFPDKSKEILKFSEKHQRKILWFR